MNTLKLNSAGLNRVTLNTIGEVTKKKAEGGGTSSYENGVYIQHIDGKLYTTEEWTAKAFANDEANGVAVKTDDCAFVVAKNDLTQKNAWSSNKNTLISEIGIFTNVTAETNYVGVQNTAYMVQYGESGAAHDCVNFTFPNGKSGYLPSCGELYTAYKKRTKLNSALTLIGGTAIPTSTTHWTSTQCNANQAWRVQFSNGLLSEIGKHNKISIRPFTELK